MFFLLLNIDTLLIFGILLLLKKDQNGYSAKIMGMALLLFCVIGVRRVFRGMFPEEDFTDLYMLDIVFDFAGLIVTPMIALYFIILTRNHAIKREYITLFGLPMLVWLPIGLIFCTFTGNEGSQYLKFTAFGIGKLPDDWRFQTLFFLENYVYIYFIKLQSVLLMLYSWVQLRRYKITLREYYSSLEGKSEKENNTAFLSIFILYTVFVVFGQMPIDMNLNSYIVHNLTYMGCTFFCFMLGYDTLCVKYTAADFLETMQQYRSLYLDDRKNDVKSGLISEDRLGQKAETEKKADRVAVLPIEIINSHGSSDVATPEQNALAARLDDAMKNQQMYLNSDLTLDDLSRTLHTNRSYLSRLINTTHNHSFSTYINCYRINYAKDLMQKEESATLDWVALQSGFLSYNSFYHTFMEFEGISPGKWRKLLNVDESDKNS